MNIAQHRPSTVVYTFVILFLVKRDEKIATAGRDEEIANTPISETDSKGSLELTPSREADLKRI